MFAQTQHEDAAKPELEDVLARYDIHPRGRRFMASCPSHEDRTPSMSVDLNKGLWKCQSCGRGGDSWTFIQEQEGLDFRRTVEFVRENGLEPEHAAKPQERLSPAQARRRKAQVGKRTAFRPSWGSD